MEERKILLSNAVELETVVSPPAAATLPAHKVHHTTCNHERHTLTISAPYTPLGRRSLLAGDETTSVAESANETLGNLSAFRKDDFTKKR